MQGYKTYTGIVLMIIGWLGLSTYITPDSIDVIAKNGIELVGAILAIYGRYKATR